MIRQVFAKEVSSWDVHSEATLRQCGQFAAYGADQPFLCFYTDEIGNRLSVMDGAATLDVCGESDEMRLFLTMDPAVHSVRTDAATAARLASEWGVDCKTESVMEAPDTAQPHDIVRECPLKDIYPLLVDGFGAQALAPFDVWYADVHHRLRRGLCRTVAVFEDGVPAACAMTVAECSGAALIGAVATRPMTRGKGYASACVLSLSAMLHAEGKRVLLSPKNEYAHRLYEKIGFTVVGEWGSAFKV